MLLTVQLVVERVSVGDILVVKDVWEFMFRRHVVSAWSLLLIIFM